MRAALLVTVCAATVLATTATSPASTHVSLRVIRLSPLTVTGSGFAASEHVTLTVHAGRVVTRRIVANRAGRFTVGFRLGLPRCSASLVRATGKRSGLIIYRTPRTGCDPPVVGSTAPPKAGTGIAGLVRRGPIAPVCTAEAPCDAPAAGVAIDVLQGSVVIGHAVTGPNGRYYIIAPPGDYVVRAAGRGAAPQPVHVDSGQFAEVDFLVDTDIR